MQVHLANGCDGRRGRERGSHQPPSVIRGAKPVVEVGNRKTLFPAITWESVLAYSRRSVAKTWYCCLLCTHVIYNVWLHDGQQVLKTAQTEYSSCIVPVKILKVSTRILSWTCRYQLRSLGIDSQILACTSLATYYVPWLHCPFDLAFISLIWVLLCHSNLMSTWCDLFRFCVKFSFLKRIKSEMDERLGATRCSLTTGRTMFHCTFIVSSERHWSTFLYFFTPFLRSLSVSSS
jgi:hypothetical protein